MSESISNSSNFQIEDAARHLLETIKVGCLCFAIMNNPAAMLSCLHL